MGLFVKRPPPCLAWGGSEGLSKARSWPFDFLAARDVDGWSLVKAEAARGGGRRPAFTRVQPSTTIGGRDRRADFTSPDPPRSPTKPRSCTPDIACLSSTLRMDVGEYATHVFPWRGAGARL